MQQLCRVGRTFESWRSTWHHRKQGLGLLTPLTGISRVVARQFHLQIAGWGLKPKSLTQQNSYPFPEKPDYPSQGLQPQRLKAQALPRKMVLYILNYNYREAFLNMILTLTNLNGFSITKKINTRGEENSDSLLSPLYSIKRKKIWSHFWTGNICWG